MNHAGIRKGDLVIHAMDAFAGAIGVSDSDGKGTPVYSIYTPADPTRVHIPYYGLLVRQMAISGFVLSLGKGIRERSSEFRHKEFAPLELPVPPLSEQQAIADYLDTKTAQIDRKIALLRQKAEKYRQLKQSLINETVTRGLDPSAPMKNSGVAWIGQVPAHWEMTRHKNCLSLISERCVDSNLPKVALENIEGQTGRYIPTDNTYDGIGIRFRSGDILFGKLRPYLAKVLLADFEGSAVGDIFVYRSQSSILPQFVQYLMLSKRYLDTINASTAGAKMPRVSEGFISNLPVFLPLLIEQKAIVQYLDCGTTHIDQIVGAINFQINKLHELRKALINDVVTGKLRVV